MAARSFLDGRITLYEGDCREVLPTLDADSFDACVTDPPYLLTSVAQRFGAIGAAPARFGADGRYARLSSGFMGRKWDAPGSAYGLSVFEAWLAGFIAGEGCFRIQAHKGGRYYTCQFSMHLRQDDAPVLLACQKRIGGRIVFHVARENKQGIKSKPDVRWLVETRDGCFALANILDRVPLFAKKAKDYALWRRALELWNNTPKANRWHGPRDVAEIAALHRQLQAVKRWDGISEVDLNFDPFMPPAQAFHYRWAREVFRVLKPGAFLVACGSTRTAHRMACAIEDAGFEIRDTVMWLYGSGFPKSHDVSKGIDRTLGAQREPARPRSNIGHQRNNGNVRPWMFDPDHMTVSDTPATDAAREWEGWGTALKPAHEPILICRKPLVGTVAENVLRFGTGALNIDGCRVGADSTRRHNHGGTGNPNQWRTGNGNDFVSGSDIGRWPANVIHDGSDEVIAAFAVFPESNSAAHGGGSRGQSQIWGSAHGQQERNEYSDSGSAARFFYSAKADSDDRLGSKHPTVKPVDLMQYLVRLVTRRGGLVLDPFAGTGTTGEAAWREGARAVLIEAEAEYVADIERRMGLVLAGPDERLHASVKARGKVLPPGPLFE